MGRNETTKDKASKVISDDEVIDPESPTGGTADRKRLKVAVLESPLRSPDRNHTPRVILPEGNRAGR